MINASDSSQDHVDALLRERQHDIFCQTDRLFGWLMLLQWPASVAAAIWITPRTWIGSSSQVHIHVWAAVILGAIITSAPVFFAFRRPGRTIGRHTIAVGQMLMSALLIDVTGGRIETHFHVFGSLAFVAFYRDWRVLITATAVVAADHFIRGVWWPGTVFGVFVSSPWRWLEHAGWVVFEDIVLVRSCLRGVREMHDISIRQAQLHATNARIEATVAERTAELNRKKLALEKEIVGRRSIEEALRETHMALLNAMPGISRLDADGRYERVNDAYAAMLGYAEEELVGVHWERTVHPDDHARGRDAYQQMKRTGTAEFEALALRKNGTAFYKHVLMVKIAGPAGNLIGHHCFMRDITDRKRAESEKDATQQKLLEVSRRAGMAEVATNVLHNVGNVLNSVNVSATLVADKLRHLQVSDLVEVTELMRQRAGDLGAFITSDEKGKLLPHYLFELGRHLVHEHGAVLQELESLTANIGHIKEIVNTQQSYARISGVVEEVSLAELVETALRFNAAAMERHNVRVMREFDQDPLVLVDKHKVLQILVNLISNAKYAADSVAPEDRRMTVRIGKSADRADFVQIAVIDNGVGIPRENLTRIFAHGFTTKKDGHGFGLHGSALSATEMGGTLTAHSDGPSRGATFTLEIPLKPGEVLK